MKAQLAQKYPLRRSALCPPAACLDFEAIYREHLVFVSRSLRRLGVRPSNVADAVQEVFVVVHRKLPSFAHRSTVRTWIFGICLRVAADSRRQDCRRRELSIEDASELLKEVQTGVDVLRAIERNQARAVLDKMLDRLDHKQRAVFTLYELEERPMKEVANAVNCPLQTAYARLYAARRNVEASLALRRRA